MEIRNCKIRAFKGCLRVVFYRGAEMAQRGAEMVQKRRGTGAKRCKRGAKTKKMTPEKRDRNPIGTAYLDNCASK